MLLTVRWPRCGPVYWAVTWGSRQYVLTQATVKDRREPGLQPNHINPYSHNGTLAAFVFIRHLRSSAPAHRITCAGSVWRVFPVGTGRRLRNGRVA